MLRLSLLSFLSLFLSSFILHSIPSIADQSKVHEPGLKIPAPGHTLHKWSYSGRVASNDPEKDTTPTVKNKTCLAQMEERERESHL